MTSRPERSGTKWTPEEEMAVLDMIKHSATPKQIAADCNRTPGAIRARLRVIARRLVVNGTPYRVAARITGLTVNEIMDACSQQARETVRDMTIEIRNLLRTSGCYRCGRSGHSAHTCYARTHVMGHAMK